MGGTIEVIEEEQDEEQNEVSDEEQDEVPEDEQNEVPDEEQDEVPDDEQNEVPDGDKGDDHGTMPDEPAEHGDDEYGFKEKRDEDRGRDWHGGDGWGSPEEWHSYGTKRGWSDAWGDKAGTCKGGGGGGKNWYSKVSDDWHDEDDTWGSWMPPTKKGGSSASSYGQLQHQQQPNHQHQQRRGGWFAKCQHLAEAVLTDRMADAVNLAYEYYAGPEQL